MIDIHAHILSNMDDGAVHIEDSLAIAREAAKQGITTMVATPHHMNGVFHNPKQAVIQQVAKLNECLKNSHIPVQILPGQEIRLYGEILEDYDRSEVLSVNDGGKYMMIEFPSNHVPRFAEQFLFDIQCKGLTPIIVHPERNAEIADNTNLLYNMIKKGALAQLTAASITGDFGKKAERLSEQFLEHNLAHFIASDVHNVNKRTIKMKEAYQKIQKKFGNEMVYMLQENAQLLVENQAIIKEMPERIRPKKFLGIF